MAGPRAIVRQLGFTLVELLIVVMMIGLLASLVVPKLIRANEDARESALETDLTMLRRQIEAYRVQHGGRLPHLDANGQPDTANLAARLSGRTDPAGRLNGSGRFGPYMMEWPTNPLVDDAVAGAVAFGTNPAPPRNGKTGWYYCTETGILSANSTTGAESLDPDADRDLADVLTP